ncbi:hypothetical protein ACVR0S_03200 [Streptococcus dentapri]|uniref:ATP-binding protein n=1 Tax=Streptococcus dentapri TaxID=573564 RepID=A0ABV8D0G1_9STRE
MTRKNHQFPLVPDDETVITTAPQMQLYDNEDLINNIHGDYQDKVYTSHEENRVPVHSTASPSRVKNYVSEVDAGKSYAELAREEARQDLKRKRQSYIAKEVKIPNKPSFQRRETTVSKSANTKSSKFFNTKMPESKKEQPNNDLARLSHNLHQDNYILAELPQTYQKPENPSTKKTKKNNYDFLKRSQIYNHEKTRQQRTHQIAKELNLTLDEE